MFWIAPVFTAIAIVLLRLGALSVWVTVFKAALTAAVGVVVILAVVLLWQKVLSKVKGLSRRA